MENMTISEGNYSTKFTNAKEELESIMGPVRDPLTTVIPMTLVYSLIFVTGTIGNMCTCFVIARNKYMHTTVNYYLFSLAVSDLMLLLCGLPQDTMMLWKRYPYALGETFCILRGMISEACTYASVLTITAFTVERYFAICHPLRAHAMATLSRAIRVIVVIWIVASLSSLPIALQLGIVYQISSVTNTTMSESAVCTVKNSVKYSFDISTGLFFVLPMILIMTLYFLIGLKLRQSSKSMASSARNSYRTSRATTSTAEDANCNVKEFVDRSPRLVSNNGIQQHRLNAASRRAVIKMLVAVVVAFFICWLPFHAQRLMATHSSEAPTSSQIILFNILTHISGITYYVSATINPILYSIMSIKFRTAFKDTLGHCFNRQSNGNDDASKFQL